MKLHEAQPIALRIKALFAPVCIRVEIGGSIRREKDEVRDIEIIAIPKDYDIGLLESGIAEVIGKQGWECVKGQLGKNCRYVQYLLPEGIKLDLFFATELNWGLIFAIRTGSAAYSHKVLAVGWVKQGYKSVGGYLMKDGHVVPVREEEDLFQLIKRRYMLPRFRNRQ